MDVHVNDFRWYTCIEYGDAPKHVRVCVCVCFGRGG